MMRKILLRKFEPMGFLRQILRAATKPSNIWAGAFLLLLAAPLGAQTPAVKTTPSPVPTPSTAVSDPPPVAPNFEAPLRPMPSAERVGVDNANQLSLTVERAIEMALDNNNDITISRKDIRIADFNFRAAKGVYDPLWTGQGYYESRTTPTASTIGGAVNGAITQRQLFGLTDIGGYVPHYGGSYDLNFNSSRLNSTNRNATLNPQFPSSFTATYTQPLWRNFRIDNNRRQIAIAAKNITLSDSQLQLKAITVITGVENAYWDLTFALRNLQVQIDTLKQAREQYESNRRLVARGVLAPIDIVAASAQISTFEQAVFAAQESVTRAENTLKTLILPERGSYEWSRPLTPVSPVALVPPQTGLDDAIADAIKNRPELIQLEINKQINKVDETYYRDQTKPEINLVGVYTSAGLAGSPNLNSSGANSVPQNLIGGYFDSLGNLLKQNYPTYRIGLTFSLPIRNRVAKANLGRTLVQGERIQDQRKMEEETVQAEVRNAIQALRSGEAKLNSAAAARAAAEQLYESEQRQFRSGTTTLYLVLQRQNDLATARGRELQAQTDLNKAIAEFQRATGITLSANNVSVSK